MTIYCPPDFQTDPAKVGRLGIVTEQGLIVYQHADPRRGPAPAVEDACILSHEYAMGLIWAAFDKRCGAVWLLPDPWTRDHFWPALCHALRSRESADHVSAHELSADGQLAGWVVQRRGEDGKGKGMPVGVYAPWVNDAWGIASHLAGADFRTVAQGLMLAAFALNMQLRFSPSYSGLAMLRQELSEWEVRNGELPELSAEWREQLQTLRPTYVEWRTKLPEAASGSRTQARGTLVLHKYDRNSSFVSSAREVGTGDPIPTRLYQPGRPGVYCIDAQAPLHWPRGLPGPFHFGEGVGCYPSESVSRVWAWEPQIRLATVMGWQFNVLEGYCWPRPDKEHRGEPAAHDLFRSWQTRMWTARNACRAAFGADSESGRLAEALVKKCGVAAVGRLVQREGRAVVATTTAKERGLRILARETDASGELTGNAEVQMDLGRTDLVQPGWWSTIIANANERLFAAIYRVAPADTLLAYVDGIWTLAPHTELDGPREKVGGWRDAGRVLVPAGLVEQLNDPSYGPGELVKQLHQLERAAGAGEGSSDEGH